jgi:hypothetical protein
MFTRIFPLPDPHAGRTVSRAYARSHHAQRALLRRAHQHDVIPTHSSRRIALMNHTIPPRLTSIPCLVPAYRPLGPSRQRLLRGGKRLRVFVDCNRRTRCHSGDGDRCIRRRVCGPGKLDRRWVRAAVERLESRVSLLAASTWSAGQGGRRGLEGETSRAV